MEMRCDSDWFHITGRLTATENDTVMFDREWNERIPRRFV
jgi:hypothetical protein